MPSTGPLIPIICLHTANLQKKCHARNTGSHRHSEGKYLTSLKSCFNRSIFWPILPLGFLLSALYCPKFPPLIISS